MKIARAIVHSKIGSLIKGSGALIPEENALIGYAIKDKDSNNFQAAAYRIRNGMAKLITVYRGSAPFKTSCFEQAAINWATAGSLLKNGAYYSPYGTLKQNQFGGFVPGPKGKSKQNNFFHVAKSPLQSLNMLANAQQVQQLDDSSPFMVSALDSDWVEIPHENTTSHSFPVYVIKRALITRFLTGLNAPAPELASTFINAVNNLSTTADKSIAKEYMLRLYDGVNKHIETLENSSSVFIKTRNYQRQKDKLLKIIGFLSNLSGVADNQRIELKKTAMKKGFVPLLITVSGTPLTVSEGEINDRFTFPHYWVTSPFENMEQTEEKPNEKNPYAIEVVSLD